MTVEDKTTKTRISGGEAFFESLFEKAADAYLILDDNRFVDCNQATVEMLRADSKDEVLATHPSELSPEFQPDGRRSDDKADEMIAIALERGSNRFEWVHRRLDGEDFPVEVVLNPIPVDGKSVIHTIWRDITERKKAERELQLTRTSIENAEDAFFWFDADANFVDVSDRTCEVLGYSREELLDMQVFDVDPAFPKEAWPDLKQQVQEKDSITLESQHQTKDGRKFPVQITVSYLEFEGEDAFFSIARDISERKEAQQELLSSEQRLRTVADFTYDWEYWLGVDGTFEYVSPSCKRISGYRAEEFRQNPDLFGKIVAPEDKQAWEEHVRTYHGEHSDAVAEMNLRIVTKENEVRWLGHVCQAVHDDDGQWQGRRASNRDITEQRQAEQRIRIFQTLADNAADAITMTDLEGQVTYANRAAYQLLGYDYDKREMIGISMASLAPEEEQARQAQAVGQLITSGGSWTDEAEAVRRDGSRIDIEATMFPLTDEEDRAVSIGAILRDITDRKLAEEAQKKYQELFLSSRDAIASVDMEGNILDTNQAFLDMLGYTTEELKEIKFTELTPEKWHAKEAQILEEQVMVRGYSDTYEKEYLHKDGHTFPVELEVYLTHDEEGNPSGFWGFIRDITERKKMEAQLEQAFERRGEQVQLSTEIAQEIATATELGQLFDLVVDLTKEQLGYYHTQLLQYDPGRDAVVLITGYGDIGEQMLAQDHQMPMGSGLIGTAADTGETVMRPTLADDPDWQPNPLLPETRGEVAVPIKMRDEVLGVLDVQSNRAGALTDDDRLLLEGLCGQIAIAIDETRLRQEMEEQLHELNALYRAMSREGWQDYRQRETLPEGFVFDQLGVKQIDPNSLTAELFADVPMVVPGGQEIGTLAVQSTDQQPLYPDEKEFLEQAAEQVALALESARLFEQAQTSAAELNRIFSSSLDMIGSANLEGYFVNLNPAWEKVTGYSEEELKSKRFVDFVHEDDIEATNAEAARIAEGAQLLEFENRYLCKDGVYRWISWRATPDLEAGLIHFVARDVTDQKVAQEAIAKQAEELATVADLSTKVSSLLDPTQMLQTVVDLTKERFDLYHAHIYLLDEAQQTLTLAAGAGDVGRQMAAEGWEIDLDAEQSLVAQAAREHHGVISNDVRAEPGFMANPLLPDTAAEMAVPLIVGDQVLGVLDVQSDQVDNFTQEDVSIKTTLSAQVAIALQNVRNFAQLDERVKELNCLNDIGHKTEETPPIPEFLQWVTERIPPAMQYPDVCVAAIELDDEIYGVPEAMELPHKIMGGIRIGDELVGGVHIAYTEKRDFLDEESALLGGIIRRVGGYIEARRLLLRTQETAEELDRIFSSSLDMIGSANLEGYFVSLNPAWEKITGYSEEELMSKPFVEFVHEDDVEATNAEAARIADGATLLEFENRYLCKDGVYRWISWRATPDLEAGLIHFIARDVTEQKEAEQELREITELQSAILEGAEYGILTTTPDGTLTLFNEGAEKMLGYTAEEVVGKHSPGIFHDMDEVIARAKTFSEEVGYEIEPGFEVFIAKAKQGLPNEHEWTYLRKDGSRFPVLLSVTALRDEDGEITGFLGIASDITERKAAQEETAKRAAELATVAELGTTVSSLMNPRQMLQTVVDLTKKRFGLYHAHIYLLNEDQQALTLEAGAGDVGRQMVAEGWEISLDAEKSLVARAARERHGVIANDVRAETGFMANPLLPDTASEMAVPLVIGDQVLGVLDVQSDQVDNFTDADVSIKTTLASQVAVALQNVRTYTRTQQQAEHETLVNVISQQIQSTTDIETALQVAVRELGRALGAKRTSVELGAPRKATSERK
jgi:PAS domain S-box-containing protein